MKREEMEIAETTFGLVASQPYPLNANMSKIYQLTKFIYYYIQLSIVQ